MLDVTLSYSYTAWNQTSNNDVLFQTEEAEEEAEEAEGHV